MNAWYITTNKHSELIILTSNRICHTHIYIVTASLQQQQGGRGLFGGLPVVKEGKKADMMKASKE
jgi:hypothetical protein